MSDDDSKRIRTVHELARSLGVDIGGDALSVIHELHELMRPMVDDGSSMDTGGGFGSADMHVTIGGVGYWLSVTPQSSVTARNERFIAFWANATDEQKAVVRAYNGHPLPPA